MQNDVKLRVNVRSRSKSLFDGDVQSLTSVNQTGEFDVLAMHANFITLVSSYVLLDKGLSSEKRIEFKSAVLSVINDRVDVYVEV